MTPLMLFALLVLGPAVLAILLRINAAVLFMSLCVGEVLVQFMAGDANSLISSTSGHGSNLSQSTIRLALLLIPVILTAILMVHSVKGSVKLIANILPALGFGLLMALLVKPLLSPAFQHTLEKTSVWHQVYQAQALVVGGSALLSLLFLWLQRRGSHDHGNSLKRSHSA